MPFVVPGPVGSGLFGKTVRALPNGSSVVGSRIGDNGAVVNAGAYTLGGGLGGDVGLVSSANSILGTVTDGLSAYDDDAARDRLYVGRAPSNAVSILGVPEPGIGAVRGGALGSIALAHRRRA